MIPSLRRLALLLPLLLLGPATEPASAQVCTNCGCYSGQCGERTPAFPAPRCVNELTAEASACGVSHAVELWPPSGFRPAESLQLPADRDSTKLYQGACRPGQSSGAEQFRYLDVADNRLYVTYNAGITVWDVGPGKEADPRKVQQRDGWNGDIWAHPAVSNEQLNFIQGVSALRASSGRTFAAAAGVNPVGTSFWDYEPTSNVFRQIFQDGDANSLEVHLFEHLGNVYGLGVAQSQSNAVVLYDLTAAKALADAGTKCCRNCAPEVLRETTALTSCGGTVRLGTLPVTGWSRYADATVVGGRLYVVTSSPGSGVVPKIYELTFPLQPQNAVVRWSGTGTFGVKGSMFFEVGGTHYLAWVRSKTIEVFDVDHCLDTDGCTTLGPPAFTRAVRNVAAEEEFLTFSTRGSTPYLYYGVLGTGILKGRAVEQLLDLSNLDGAGTTGEIPEITAGGGTYLDPGCSGLADPTVDYWGRYYPGNQLGLNDVEPHNGKWNGNYFYRAAESILDIHVGGGGGGGAPTVTSTAVSAPPHYAGDSITFSAQAQSCDGAGNWQWNADVVPTTGLGSVTSTTVLAWPFCGPSRCADDNLEVWAVKDACATHPDLVINAAEITLVDPRPEVAAIDAAPASPTSTYPVCTAIDLSATVLGKPPFTHAWTIRRVGIGGPAGEVATSAAASWSWDTTGIELDLGPEVFANGFESGDLGAWSAAVNLASGQTKVVSAGAGAAQKAAGSADFEIQLVVGNATLATDVASEVITLTSLGSLAFDDPAVTSLDLGGGAYRFTAHTQNATAWRWELEDPANGSSVGCEHFTKCQVLDFSSDAQVIEFAWTPANVAGTFGVAVRARNCENLVGAAHSFAHGVPVIDQPAPPTVDSFTLDLAASPGCSGSLGFVDCTVGTTIVFRIATSNAPTHLELDWNGDGTFDQTVAATPIISKSFSVVGPVVPAVRAKRGTLVSATAYLSGFLTIVP